MAHDHPINGAQFPWTPEGQAAKADFTQWLRDRDKQEFLDHVVALHEDFRELKQQNQLMMATAELLREVCGWLRPSSNAATIPKPQEDEKESPQHTPSIPVWRTYRGFLSDMLMREQVIVERGKELDTKPILTKENFAGHTGGDSVKTISRTMRDYGLDPDRNWPPSTWPKRAPRSTIDGPSLLAAALCGWALLDFVSDGRFDNSVRMVRFLGCHIGLPL